MNFEFLRTVHAILPELRELQYGISSEVSALCRICQIISRLRIVFSFWDNDSLQNKGAWRKKYKYVGNPVPRRAVSASNKQPRWFCNSRIGMAKTKSHACSLYRCSVTIPLPIPTRFSATGGFALRHRVQLHVAYCARSLVAKDTIE